MKCTLIFRNFSWCSNSQSTVHISQWQLLLSNATHSPSVSDTFSEHRAVNNCTACIRQTIVNEATLPTAIYTYCEALQQIKCNPVVCFWRDNVFGLGVLMENKGEILYRNRVSVTDRSGARAYGEWVSDPLTRQREKRRCNGCRN
jgi:hypothetical protein